MQSNKWNMGNSRNPGYNWCRDNTVLLVQGNWLYSKW